MTCDGPDEPAEPDEIQLSPAAAALSAFLERREAGENVSFAHFAAEHPEVADDLMRLHDRLAAAAGALRPPPASKPTYRDDAPRRLGPYEILSRVGAGGMGTVYSARLAEEEDDADGPPNAGRPIVALKVLRRELTSQRGLERFELERRTLQTLSHPNIARVLDSGVGEHGEPFITMEYVDGSPITKATETLELASALGLFLDVCDAVEHAHSRGVLHRDLKPSNILVRHSDRSVKVIDFGLARALDDDDRPFRTTAGVLLGTPEYMSPEQAAAGTRDVDARSDVFSLGVLLYEILTGRHPFVGPGGAGPVELLRRIVREDPPPLDEARPTGGGRALPSGLDRVVLRALAKGPDARHGSVAALAEELRGFQTQAENPL